jgi:hypothetical protein
MSQETIALVFDFDDTLAPCCTSGYLERQGVEPELFWQTEVQSLVDDGWDPIPAYLYGMIGASRAGRIPPMTKESLESWGPEVPLFNGVTGIFDRLRKHTASLNPSLNLEFYVISSGIGDIVRNTVIAPHFTDIWSCDFAYDENGHAHFPKRLVSFTDKTRYLFQISKGQIGPEARTRPFDVNLKVPSDERRIPLNQMIFVGDGYTDVPCFSLVKKRGGIAIGVYDGQDHTKWGRAWGFLEQNRVSNLAPTDYTEHSALSNALMMSIDSIANKISLAQSSYQG